MNTDVNKSLIKKKPIIDFLNSKQGKNGNYDIKLINEIQNAIKSQKMINQLEMTGHRQKSLSEILNYGVHTWRNFFQK